MGEYIYSGNFWSGLGYENARGAGFGGADGQGDWDCVGRGASWTQGYGHKDNTGQAIISGDAGTTGYGEKHTDNWCENDTSWEENE